MGQVEHDGYFPGIGIDIQIPCDADEAGEVAAVILHRIFDTFKRVKLGAVSGGESRQIPSAAFSHIFCRRIET